MTLPILTPSDPNTWPAAERAEALARGWIVPVDDDADPICPICGEPFADAGDGYDGMCPDCADRAEVDCDPDPDPPTLRESLLAAHDQRAGL